MGIVTSQGRGTRDKGREMRDNGRRTKDVRIRNEGRLGCVERQGRVGCVERQGPGSGSRDVIPVLILKFDFL